MTDAAQNNILVEWLSAISFTVSKANIQLRFDGPEVQAHEMDVCLLGPSLVALGELCTEANAMLNGDQAKVKVLVHADVRANCVTLDLSVVQTIWQHTTSAVALAHVAGAKEILQWLGIIRSTGVLGLLQFLRWRKDKKEVAPAEIIRTSHGSSQITIKIAGENNTVNVIQIPEQVHKLSKSIKAVEAAKTLVAPVSDSEGIVEEIFIHGDGEPVKIDKAFASDLKMAYADVEDLPAQTFTAFITVYTVTLDQKTKHWRFKLNGKVETIDVSDSSIINDALQRGVHEGDTYRVKLEMKQHKTKAGDYKADYKVVGVLDFIPGARMVEQPLFPPDAS